MSHKLGSVVAVAPPLVIGPTSGVPAGPGKRKVTFSPAPHPTGNKFLLLHFSAAALGAGDLVEVELVYSQDSFDSTSGPDFWSRPLKGDSVDIFFTDGGGGAGQVTLVEYGRGEGIQLDGADGDAGGNGNGDLFGIDTAYVEPGFFNTSGVCPSGSSPSWENVDQLPAGVMRDTARSAGMFIEAAAGKVSSCSAALIGPDLILTAAHCVASGTEVPSGSFTLDVQTDSAGSFPPGYNPKFHKLKRLVKAGWTTAATGVGLNWDSGLDYAVIQIETPPGGLGVPPRAIRPSLPANGEELFVIHHPRGRVKKVSRKPADPTCQVISNTGGVITYNCDSDNGSSGSPVFDAAGQIVAVNDWVAGTCTSPTAGANRGQAAALIVDDITKAPPPDKDVDVMLVLDRSGSMSLADFTGGTKIEKARRAAALFLDLLRLDKTHRAGLVTFSTTATTNFALAAATAPNRDALIGPPPAHNAGIVGGIGSGGTTTIGGGLAAGQAQLPAPGPAANTPALLLLTDGLQNTPPMIADVEASLGTTRLCIIGFGTEASLDGPLLTNLARNHGGIYTRAGEGLELEKFFVLCFGNIFETAISADPFFVLPAGATAAAPIPFGVCGEDQITVVLAWDHAAEDLILSLETPAGNTITAATPGITASAGDVWVWFRVPLPFAGERDGTWRVRVTRFAGGGEFPSALPEERFFITVGVTGGPFFRPVAPARRYYTGDTINPQVVLRYPSGLRVPEAKITVEVESPQQGTGNILTASGLGPATVVDGDQLDARAGTLIAMEQAKGKPLVTTAKQTFELFDDGRLDGIGAMEPDGIYGNPLQDLARQEGHYTFHARATFGQGCSTSRETFWSAYVAVGIDPECTKATTQTVGTLPGGNLLVRITFKPCDRYGNFLGPARGDSFSVDPLPGSGLVGGLQDNGDGSYTQEVSYDPASTAPPQIGVTQPGRPLVPIFPLLPRLFSYSVKFVCGVQPDCPCECAPVRPGIYATEINIHNFHDRDVKVAKHVLPVVLAGAVAGREPRTVERKASDSIVLPPHSATMDDCCRIAQMLLGAIPSGPLPLTIGWLEILSPVELAVTAVYTVTDLSGGATNIDVVPIQAGRA